MGHRRVSRVWSGDMWQRGSRALSLWLGVWLLATPLLSPAAAASAATPPALRAAATAETVASQSRSAGDFTAGAPAGGAVSLAPTPNPTPTRSTPAAGSQPRAAAAPAAALGNLRFIAPVRVVDTRAASFNGTGPIGFDGTGGGCVPIGATSFTAGQTRRFRVGGCAFGTTSLPADTTGVMLNVTVIQAQASGGFVTVFPGDVADANRPGTSTVNPSTAVAANFTTIGLPLAGGNPGTFAVFSSNAADLAIDVVGYYSPSLPTSVGNLVFVNPIRVVDTRGAGANGTGPIGFDGTSGNPIGVGALVPEQTRLFRVAGKSFGTGAGLAQGAPGTAVSFPADTAGLLAHVTIVQSQASGGFTTLLPGDATGRPGTSSVNPSTAIAFNAWAVGVPASGNIGLFSTNPADVIVDIVGYYSPSAPAAAVGDLTLVTPVRVLDTRANDPPGIVTAGYQPNGSPIAAGAFAPGPSGEVRRYLLGGKSFGSGANTVSFPADITGVLASVTLVQPQASGGFITVFPGDVADANRPNASTVNPVTAVAASFWANGVPSSGAAAGQVAVFSTNAADVIVDVLGYFRAATPAVVNAPPLDMSVATDICSATQFLFTGTAPVQTGVNPSTLNCQARALVRGKTIDRTGVAMPGVTVSVLGHPEFGQTVSRADGQFDLAINGGGTLNLNLTRDGFLPVQRQFTTAWQAYLSLPDIALIPRDTASTAINLTGAAGGIQVHRATVQSDTEGSRQATLFFTGNTTATVTLPGGATQALASFHVRATEYTVGPNGPAAMPGTLPPDSAYTYAVSFSVDEADALGATSVSFSRPVPFYLDNFLHFQTGADVPMGYYDRTKGAWVASDNGRVVKVLSTAGGTASLDVDGTGNPASAGALAALGITAAEQQQLASLYAAGATLWRVPILHFSDWDSNWGFAPPPDAEPPPAGIGPVPDPASNPPTPNPPSPNPPQPPPPPCPDEAADGSNGASDGAQGRGATAGAVEAGGISGELRVDTVNLVCRGQVRLAGTPFTLNYSADRMVGRTSANTLPIALSGASLPTNVIGIKLEVQVAGQRRGADFEARPNQTASFLWDQLDGYGRRVQGRQQATVRIGYAYHGVYVPVPRFGYKGNGFRISADRTRQEVTLWREVQTTIGEFDARAIGLGGWSLDVHHIYDPVARVLHLGTGQRRDSGTGNLNAVVDSMPATGPLAGQAQFHSPYDVAVAPDGTLYVADHDNFVVLKVGLDGSVVPVAGGGQASLIDNMPGTQAYIGKPEYLAMGPDGSVYIIGGINRVIRLGPEGNLHVVAGTGAVGFAGDGGPATAALMDRPLGLAVTNDGTVYFGDASNTRIRRVGPDGIITTVAGNGQTCGNLEADPAACFDGQPAISSPIGGPLGGITVTPDGTIYFISGSQGYFWKIGSDGILHYLGGSRGSSGGPFTDGVPLSTIDTFNGINKSYLKSGPDGSLYFVMLAGGNTYRVRRAGPDQILSTVAGMAGKGFNGDGRPALDTLLNYPTGVAVGPDGAIYIADLSNNRIRRVQPTYPGFSAADYLVASDDGRLVYRFNPQGRHLNTYYALTGAVVHTFGYDSTGRLSSVTAGDNNVTTIQRDANGNPTRIVGPYGQTTALTLDANGYLATVTDPTGTAFALNSTAGGLITGATNGGGPPTAITYDAAGFATQFDPPGTGAATYTHSVVGTTSSFTETTALLRTTGHRFDFFPSNGRLETTRLPDGTLLQVRTLSDGSVNTLYPDGSGERQTVTGDPRFNAQVSIEASRLFTTPGGLQYSAQTVRAVDLATPTVGLSLRVLTDTVTLNGNPSTTVFNAGSRTFTATSAGGRTASETIDLQGRPLTVTAPGITTIAYSYHARGLPLTVSAGSGGSARSLSYAYTPAGFLQSITDGLGQVTAFTHNSVGRILSKTLPGGQSIGFGYDAVGNLTSITPPGRPAHVFTYGAGNHPVGYTPPAVTGCGTCGTSETYTYDADGARTSITRLSGALIAFVYNAAGRVATLTTPRVTRTYSYSPTTGQLTGITSPADGVNLAFTYDGPFRQSSTWSGTVAGTVGFSYDNNLRRSAETVNNANPIAFTYDADDLVTAAGALSITHDPQSGLPTASSLGTVVDTTSYTPFAEPQSYSATAGATALYGASYTYDRLGRVATKAETIGGVTTTWGYTYDAPGRLTAVTRNGAAYSSAVFDGNGNRTSSTDPGGTTTATYDARDRLVSSVRGASTTTYAYRASGELQSKTVTGTGTTQYVYDDLGQLISVTLPNSTVLTYLIDGKNRRVGKKVGATLQRGFLYSNDLRVVAELDGANNVVSRFVYADDRNVPAYMIKGGVNYRLLVDQRGSVRRVVNAATGSVVQQIDYDAWGRVLSDSNPAFQPFGFAGGLYDPDTGLVRFGARDYDAESGRWTAPDPSGLIAASPNRYLYAEGDPVNVLDENGLEPNKSGYLTDYCPNPTFWERLQHAYNFLKEFYDNHEKAIENTAPAAYPEPFHVAHAADYGGNNIGIGVEIMTGDALVSAQGAAQQAGDLTGPNSQQMGPFVPLSGHF